VVESSADFGDSALYVSLTRNASASTRRALPDQPFVGTCAVPGEHVSRICGTLGPALPEVGRILLAQRTESGPLRNGAAHGQSRAS
jgi:hypothetical protein